MRRTTAVAVAGAVLLALAPAAASAATVTVKGDDGNPLALAPGVPATIRNMDPDVGVAAGAAAKGFARSVTGPDGTSLAFGPNACWSGDLLTNIGYRGNGPYTITVSEFADPSCKSPLGPPATYGFVVAASVAIAAPTRSVLTRAKNSLTINVQELGFNGNPGALGYDVRYAPRGVIGADGGISGPAASAFVNSTTGKIELRLSNPGTYTVVARADGGEFNSPWSAPVQVKAQAPFDLAEVLFPDSRGPSYALRGRLREKFAHGTVKIAIARGKRGGRFRSLGSARLRANGTFFKRFTLRRLGYYRLRYSFKGSARVRKGSVTELVRIRRRIF